MITQPKAIEALYAKFQIPNSNRLKNGTSPKENNKQEIERWFSIRTVSRPPLSTDAALPPAFHFRLRPTSA